MTIPVSACIICKDEARRIGAALDSLAWCSDIVVVDSHSTDDTVQIASGHSAHPRILVQDWLGYSAQREFAVAQCRNDWVLMLDADEECAAALIQAIQELTAEQTREVGIFRVRRKNFLAGRHVRCWDPDWQTRLIHRQRVEWDRVSIPERRRCKAGFREGKLPGCLLHDRRGEYTRLDLVNGPQMAEYADALSESLLRAKGRRASWLNLVFRPALAFLKYYVLRGGFLQGRLGLVIAYKSTIGVMLKYSALYSKQELEHRDSQ